MLSDLAYWSHLSDLADITVYVYRGLSSPGLALQIGCLMLLVPTMVIIVKNPAGELRLSGLVLLPASSRHPRLLRLMNVSSCRPLLISSAFADSGYHTFRSRRAHAPAYVYKSG